MILSDLQRFGKYITVAADIDTAYVAEWLEMVDETERTGLFGDTLYEKICALPESDNFRILCEKYISHRGFYEAIPHLDLVLTNNGFGVVGGNGSKYVPASKDRVAALRLQEDIWSEKIRGFILSRIVAMESYLSSWQTSEAARNITGGLYFSYDDYRTYVPAEDMSNPEVYRKVLARVDRVLNVYVFPFISREQYGVLLEKQYNGSLDREERNVLADVKSAVGGMVRSDMPISSDIKQAHVILSRAVNVMCFNLEKFPQYALSDEYRLKTAEPYENKKDDATYFSGI